ncbi:unnamed protein product [Toxocara canis]|nr:unnamed protein product [Toxocara canis]
MYSMNRRQRWNRLTAKKIFCHVANADTSIGVLEKWDTSKG